MADIKEPLAENWAAFVAMIESAPNAGWGMTSHGAKKDGKDDDDGAWQWTGTRTWEDAMERAKFGSPEDAARVSRALDVIRQEARYARINGKRHDVAGDRPNIGRAIAGDPAHMIRRTKVLKTSRPVVRLLVNCGARADVRGGMRLNRGAAILSQIDALEAAGQRVEITLVWKANGHDKNTHEARCIVKQASEPCNVEALAFALINPSTHRRFAFALREQHASLYRWAGGYGSSQNVTPEPGQIYLPLLTSDHKWAERPGTAAQHIAEFLATAQAYRDAA